MRATIARVEAALMRRFRRQDGEQRFLKREEREARYGKMEPSNAEYLQYLNAPAPTKWWKEKDADGEWNVGRGHRSLCICADESAACELLAALTRRD